MLQSNKNKETHISLSFEDAASEIQRSPPGMFFF